MVWAVRSLVINLNTGGVLVAVIVTTEPVGADELTAFAREQLPGHKVPKSIHFVDALPKNASGKLLKRELRDQLASERV
jgi:fatty-acyl-CoA synthase